MQEDKNVKKKGFLKGMRAELKKVIWPTGKQTVKSTFVTIAFVLIISIALIVLNLIFGKLSSLWINSLPNDNIIINTGISGEANGGEVTDKTLSGEVSGEVISGDILDVISGDITSEVISGEIVSGE